MDLLSWLAVLLGIGALLLIALAVFRGEFADIERPKYEMLGRDEPRSQVSLAQKQPGKLGIEDRVVRLGLAVAAGYYASRLWNTAAGWPLALIAVYLGLTALIARDIVYRLCGIDTRTPEHRGG